MKWSCLPVVIVLCGMATSADAANLFNLFSQQGEVVIDNVAPIVEGEYIEEQAMPSYASSRVAGYRYASMGFGSYGHCHKCDNVWSGFHATSCNSCGLHRGCRSCRSHKGCGSCGSHKSYGAKGGCCPKPKRCGPKFRCPKISMPSCFSKCHAPKCAPKPRCCAPKVKSCAPKTRCCKPHHSLFGWHHSKGCCDGKSSGGVYSEVISDEAFDAVPVPEATPVPTPAADGQSAGRWLLPSRMGLLPRT